jgi:hypothetical protein
MYLDARVKMTIKTADQSLEKRISSIRYSLSWRKKELLWALLTNPNNHPFERIVFMGRLVAKKKLALTFLFGYFWIS